MNSRERVLAALRLEPVDKIPYVELHSDRALISRLLGRDKQAGLPNKSFDGFQSGGFGFTGGEWYTPAEMCELLSLDSWGFLMYPLNASAGHSAETKEGDRTYVSGGDIKTSADLKKLKLADLDDNRIFDYIGEYLHKHKGDYAVFAATNIGTDPVLLGLGFEAFSYALADNLGFIEEMLDMYTDWIGRMVKKVCELDFDYIWYTDDIAYKNGMMFSPEFYRETCVPRLRKAVATCTKPWVYHTDGNFLDVIDDLLDLGVKGLAPIEPIAMDIFDFKRDYEKKVCTMGNIDLDILSLGTESEVIEEVETKLKKLGKTPGYIMSSSNSLTVYCKDENIRTMVDTFRRFRGIDVDG